MKVLANATASVIAAAVGVAAVGSPHAEHSDSVAPDPCYMKTGNYTFAEIAVTRLADYIMPDADHDFGKKPQKRGIEIGV